jgi:hypothetical protein
MKLGWMLLVSVGLRVFWPAHAQSRFEAPIELTMNESAGRWSWVVLKLRLEGGEEIPVTLSTAASLSVLDKSYEARLGRPWGKRKYETVFMGVPKTKTATEFKAPEVTIEGRAFPLGRVVTEDLSREVYAPAIKGLLGMDALMNYCVQLDFEANRIRLMRSGEAQGDLGQVYSMVWEKGLPGIRAEALGGEPNSVVMIDTTYDADGVTKARPFGRSFEWNQIRWGGATYTNLVVGRASGRELNCLGLDFLARHLVTLDFPAQQVYLKQRSVGPLESADQKEVGDYLWGLEGKGSLPGWPQKSGTLFGDPYSVLTLAARPEGETTFTYHYKVKRAASGWQIEKAWKSDAAGKVVQQFPAGNGNEGSGVGR